MVPGAVRGDAGRRCVPLQGPGPLSGSHLAGLSRYGRGVPGRAGRARPAARRAGRRHVRPLPRVLHRRHGGHVRRRHLLRHLHDLLGRRGRISAGERRRLLLPRRKPGVRRQGPAGRGRAAPSAQDHRVRYPRAVPVPRRAADQLRGRGRARPRAAGRHLIGGTAAHGARRHHQAARYRGAGLHVRHHRAAEGRHARSCLADVGLCQRLPGGVPGAERGRASRHVASAGGASHRALDVDVPAAGGRRGPAHRRGGRGPAAARSTRCSRPSSTWCRASWRRSPRRSSSACSAAPTPSASPMPRPCASASAIAASGGLARSRGSRWARSTVSPRISCSASC